jgi:hypothetical protein
MLGDGDGEALRRLLGEREREDSEYESDRDRSPRETDLLLAPPDPLLRGEIERLGDRRDLGSRC